MHKNLNYRELHNTTINSCFGCGPNNSFGIRMKFFSDEEAVYSYISVPKHMGGWQNIAHGGIVCTILDEIMSWAALYLLKKITLTNSMTVDFIKAVPVREKLRAEGRVIDYNGKHNAIVEGILYNQQDELCAKSKADFNVLSPKLAKRTGFVTDEHIKEFFEPLISR